MATETTEAVRQAGNLQNLLDRHRVLLNQRPRNGKEIYRQTAELLRTEFDQDLAKIVQYIRVKLDWPLSYKRVLLRYVQHDTTDRNERFRNLANFVLDPTAKIKSPRQFHFYLPTIASVERQYGSGVCSIFHLQHGFFLINLLTFVVWVSLITIPYKVVTSSTALSNESFTFSSLFTTKGYLAESIFFQGSYPNEIVNNKYNLPLIYFLTTYLYFFIWFIFITIRFASTYKQKVFNSILSTKLGIGFMCTFGRNDYTIQTNRENQKHRTIFQRLYRDLIENDERIQKTHFNQYKSAGYKFKIIVTNLFYIILAFALGGLNWMILSFCEKPTIDCHQSIIYLSLINRLVPYVIAILTQIEQYKYLSYKLDAVGIRCILLNVCTILSFTIYFFINSPSCYETAFGQYIYILLLADLFASLVFPLLFGLLFDFISRGKNRDFDGINLHVQLSPPVLLYSQFLIWIGIYFAPLLSIMILLNICFSFLSHRLYLYIRSRRSDSYKRVFVWNAYRLEYLIYFLAYFLLIVSTTCFAVFTTQITPSETCGPFRHLNGSYEVMGNFVYSYKTSVLWVSVINFLTSPGLIYFLGVTFFIVAYKLRHEGLAEKQLVFIHESNLESKKHLRQSAVHKLHQHDAKKERRKTHSQPKSVPRQDVVIDAF
ncbi:unnamed protein product [Adineta ricciae]|uniref:TMC domain-containing protein n=1 Tax=Adineta ricciae TaxID=249248 RepID=A0A813V013_ADIRI|nr:unnamed protein product [Adineta ricciae]CAF1131007.1 unnamed protein product [Adineta ricciae]